MKTVQQGTTEKRHRYGFPNLLVWLFVYLLVGPFLGEVSLAKIIFSVFMTAVLFSAAYMINRHSVAFIPSTVVLLLTISLLWLVTVFGDKLPEKLPERLTSGSTAVYMGILVYSFGRHIILARRVTTDVICAALCLYLIIGMMWGAFFMLLESFVPGSFGGGALEGVESPELKEYYLRYFSFVTLSTLGYGDITPQTQGATALRQAEAVIGQFFALVLVALLVGLHAQETAEKRR